MIKILGKCPTCGRGNPFILRTNAEQLADLEDQYERVPEDGNMPAVIADFRARKDMGSISPESFKFVVKCEQCGEPYSIKDSANWNEIKKQIC